MRGSLNGIRLFEGEMGNLTPSFDYDLVSSCFFAMVGKMILHSVIHECRGLPGISPAVILPSSQCGFMSLFVPDIIVVSLYMS